LFDEQLCVIGAYKCTYANDTGIAGNIVLTGEEQFTVKEIEVFEVSAAE
jgi:hypothetical protein